MEIETSPSPFEVITEAWTEAPVQTGGPFDSYRRPGDILGDPRLDAPARRALLCAWASDASAAPDQPTLRRAPGVAHTAPLVEIMAAIRQLDH